MLSSAKIQRAAKLAVLAWLATTGPALAAGRTLVVSAGAVEQPGICDSPPQMGSIQDAIRAASPGDTVLVCPGVYAEALTIDKPITVRSTDGPAATVIAAPLAYASVTVSSPGATLGGLDDSAPGGMAGFTIRTQGEPDVRPGSSGPAPPLVFADVSSVGVYVPGAGDGPAAPPDDVAIEGNVVSGFDEVGISVGLGADRAQVRGNKVLLAAVPASPSLAGVLAGGPMSDTLGIALNSATGLAATDDAQIVGNTVLAAPGTGTGDDASRGIAIAGLAASSGPGRGPEIAGNEILGRFARGVDLEVSGSSAVEDARVHDNTVQGATVGVDLGEGVENATVTGNSLTAASAVDAMPPPADPSANVIDLSDSSSGGIYADELRNLIYDNRCFGPDGTGPAHSSPDGVCGLAAPPTPTLSVGGPVVQGIPQTVDVAAPGDQVRIAVGGTGRAPADYGSWETPQAVTVTRNELADLVVHAQARTDANGAYSAPVTLDVPVEANQLPVTQPIESRVDEDHPDTVRLAATQPADEASENVTFDVVGDPQHGTLGAISPAGDVTYTPDANYNGPDSFDYIACDGFSRPGNPDGCSDPQPVDVTVDPVNDVPAPAAASGSGDEDSAGIEVDLSATDVENDPISFRLAGVGADGTLTTAHGAVTLDGATATYVPAKDFNGTDTFTWEACDADCSAPRTATVTVAPVNDPPTADPVDVAAAEDTPAHVQLAGHDIDTAALTYTVAGGPAHGRLGEVSDDGRLTYTPDPNYNGEDSFSYTVGDGEYSATAEAHISVAAVNDPPTAVDTSGAGDEDSAGIAVSLSGGDVDGDALTFTLVGANADGTLTTGRGGRVSLADATATYVPASDFNGGDSFEYVACDAQVCSAPSTAQVTVRPVDDAPVAHDATARAAAGSAVVVDLSATDVDGDPLTYEVAQPPASGSVTIAGSQARYVPKPGFSGTDAFRFRAVDPSGAAGTAAVSIDVAAVTGSSVARAKLAGSARKITGTVLVTAPGGQPVPLEAGAPLPQAATVDARAGQVTIDLSGTGQHVTAAQGTFVLRTVREGGRAVAVLRMAAPAAAARAVSAPDAGPSTLRLLLAARCRCRVVSRDATVSPVGAARWTMTETARRTVATVLAGRVVVADRVHPCPPHVLSAPLHGGSRFSYVVPWTPLRHRPAPGHAGVPRRC